MKNVNIHPPIVDYYNKLKVFLEQDEDIKVNMDYTNRTIFVNVAKPVKGYAITQILPKTKTAGDYSFNIEVDYEDGVDEGVIDAALWDNPLYFGIHTSEDTGYTHAYFTPTIVQFLNDNLASPEGLETRTAEDLAREIFDIPQLMYCSEPVDECTNYTCEDDQ